MSQRFKRMDGGHMTAAPARGRHAGAMPGTPPCMSCSNPAAFPPLARAARWVLPAVGDIIAAAARRVGYFAPLNLYFTPNRADQP